MTGIKFNKKMGDIYRDSSFIGLDRKEMFIIIYLSLSEGGNMKRLKSNKDFVFRRIKADTDRCVKHSASGVLHKVSKGIFCECSDTASPDFLVGTILLNSYPLFATRSFFICPDWLGTGCAVDI